MPPATTTTAVTAAGEPSESSHHQHQRNAINPALPRTSRRPRRGTGGTNSNINPSHPRRLCSPSRCCLDAPNSGQLTPEKSKTHDGFFRNPSQGKKLVFVTNNSTKSRMQYAKKFHSLGIPVNEDEIFLSSFSAAMYLKVNDFPREKKVYVIGEEGILEELEQAGFTSLGVPADGKKNIELKSNCLFEHDKSVGAVIVGLDQYINFYKLQYATLCIRENPGCLFIATNRDAVGHLTDLQEWPGAGCMVAAVCGTTQKEPITVGKPSTFLMDFLLQ
ncbi:Phosphoglycolate phosphatase 2, partial [Capsicum baccatum]